jgi:hypothetical protein
MEQEKMQLMERIHLIEEQHAQTKEQLFLEEKQLHECITNTHLQMSYKIHSLKETITLQNQEINEIN